jgi:hypothetical protein
VQACYCGQRSCDRLTTSKQTAATGRSIQSAKLSAEAAGPSVFGGVRDQTWRANAHGRRRGLGAFGEASKKGGDALRVTMVADEETNKRTKGQAARLFGHESPAGAELREGRR